MKVHFKDTACKERIILIVVDLIETSILNP